MATSRSSPTAPVLGPGSVRFRQDSLIPAQQPTSLKLTKRTDFYEQRCVKFPGRACFHCYAEFIHALLLEADPTVTSFVPQPYQMVVHRELYVPDVYLVRNGRIEVLELKPGAQFESAKLTPLRAFFAQYGMHFDVLANETVFERERLALHWLPIVQVLAQAHYQGLETGETEQRLFDAARDQTVLTVGDLLGDAPRAERYWAELALYRLLHRHDVHCDLSNAPLDYDTEVTAWS